MRDIKFRAWNKETKCFFMWNLSFAFGGTGAIWGEVQQYTGLKDKNGKEIYEGDILKMSWGNYLNGVVKFSEKYGYYSFNSRTSEYDFIETQSDEYEIIGNIHENPDLTK